MKVIAFAGGHRYNEAAFGDLLAALPAEVTLMAPEGGPVALSLEQFDGVDASLHYEMPGAIPAPVPAPDSVRETFRGLLARGHGFVFVHHAIAAWPAWPEWAELLGGAFLYRPGVLRGQEFPDSGYRHDVPQQVRVLEPQHPVVRDLPATFSLVDETYLCPVFPEGRVPLLATDAPITDRTHYSTELAMQGRMDARDGWQHPAGSQVVAWASEHGTSRIVYLQPGDTASTLRDPNYHALVTGALEWVARRR